MRVFFQHIDAGDIVNLDKLHLIKAGEGVIRTATFDGNRRRVIHLAEFF